MTLWDHHYVVRFDDLVRACEALTDVWELMGHYDQEQLLGFLFPTVQDRRGLWAELTRPLAEISRLDSRTAYQIQRDLGATGPLDMQTAYDRVRQAIELEIGDIIRRHRTDMKAVAS